MKRRRWSAQAWRRGVLLAGSVAALGHYAWHAMPLPRRTPVGVEQRLFGVGNAGVGLSPSPSGARVLLTPGADPAPAQPSLLDRWLYAARALQWPGSLETPRRVTFFRPESSWFLEGSALRRAWQYTDSEWLDEQHLNVLHPDGTFRVLDLRTGRIYAGEAASKVAAALEPSLEEMPYWNEGFPFTRSALEEMPPDVGDAYLRYEIAGRRVFLIGQGAADTTPCAIYAASDEEAPRLLRLTSAGELPLLMPDGKTVYFTRQKALWRLDLRKSLPALLDEVKTPTLPLPELSQ